MWSLFSSRWWLTHCFNPLTAKSFLRCFILFYDNSRSCGLWPQKNLVQPLAAKDLRKIGKTSFSFFFIYKKNINYIFLFYGALKNIFEKWGWQKKLDNSIIIQYLFCKHPKVSFLLKRSLQLISISEIFLLCIIKLMIQVSKCYPLVS